MESQLLARSQPTTSPDSSQTDHLIREWLFRFGLQFSKDVVPLLALWQEQLGGLEPATLQQLFEHTVRTCRFFPTIAEILEQTAKADSAGLELEAQAAWERYLAHIQKYFHPDLGWDRRAPHMDAITEHAGRAAGGARWIDSCPESELQWCRKRFLEAYTRAHETGQVQNLLTRGEAKRIIASLTAPVLAKQLPPPTDVRPEPLHP